MGRGAGTTVVGVGAGAGLGLAEVADGRGEEAGAPVEGAPAAGAGW
ncbi:hypothetical protein [Actinospongicola halichondriae]